jgi:hypothetical protein
MPRGVFTPFQFLPPQNYGAPGNANATGGGGGPFFRDAMDARRSMYNQTPEAMYPDGYLGTINTRRGDRLLDNLKNRQNQRSYQRGVHKGERIDPSDYYWPGAMQPDRRLVAEAQGIPYDTSILVQRDAPQGQYLPTYSPRQQVMRDTNPGVGTRSSRSDAFKRLGPTWR